MIFISFIRNLIRDCSPHSGLRTCAARILTCSVLLTAPSAAFAACANPAGEAAHIIYNADHKVMQYCDGTNWIAMGGQGSGAGGCANPVRDEATIIFNVDYAVMQYCAGNQWKAMGPLGADINTGLVGHWKLDESSGVLAADSSGFGNAATLTNGPAWQPSGGALAGALQLDGADDYLEITAATDDLYPSSNAFTIAAWIYMPTFGAVNQHIMQAYDNAGTNFIYQFFVDPSGYLQFTIHSGGDTYHIASNPLIPGQFWYHVAAVFDGEANWVEIYINGVTQTLLPGYAHLESGNYSPTPDIGLVRIGHVDTLGYFPGKIDDLRFYNHSLSAQDIVVLYNSGTTALQAAADTTTGIMAHWKLDEGTGTTATDSIGGYNGTLTNFPASPWLNPAMIDGALTFDGTNDYVNIGDIDAFDGMSAMTVSAWVKTTSNAEQHIISKGGCQGNIGGGSWEFGIADPASNLNSTFFALYDPASGASVASCSGGTYPENTSNVHDGQWHHVAGTWNGSTGIAYIDGIPCSSTIPFTSMDSTNDSVEMGGECNGINPNRLNGTIDDVRIYNRALSGADIQVLAKYAIPDCTAPSGYAGELIYNVDAALMQYCNGTKWIAIGKEGAPPPPEPRKVFVTSTTYNGNLGGAQGAHDKCQTRATAAGLTGTYLAWISTGAGNQPSSTFTQSPTGYMLVDGTKVADTWADLTNGTLDTAINVNEFGQNTAGTNVWTNVSTNGATKASASTCVNWTNGTAGNSGHRGSNTSATATWTDAGTTACNNARRLYCFQQ